MPVIGTQIPEAENPDAQLEPFSPYMGEPADFGERLRPEDLRLKDVTDSFSDSGGSLALVFDPVPLGRGWWGSVSVPSAPPAAVLSLYLNNQLIGTITGSNPWGPLAVLGGERLSILGTGLSAAVQYSGIFVGVQRDSTDVADLVAAVVPQVQSVTPAAGAAFNVVLEATTESSMMTVAVSATGATRIDALPLTGRKSIAIKYRADGTSGSRAFVALTSGVTSTGSDAWSLELGESVVFEVTEQVNYWGVLSTGSGTIEAAEVAG